MRLTFGLLALAVLAAQANAQAAGGDAVTELFNEAGVVGTLVVARSNGEVVFVHNAARAMTRLSPASTFKVPNTLIALDEGVVDSAGYRFTWDGEVRGIDAWNRDQTLRSALQVSCVWCYQEIARAVGRQRYEKALALLEYGNREIGPQVDRFWLDGSLRISALEQIRFLSRLVNGYLPYNEEHRAILADIMRTDADGYGLYAKSGWTGEQLATGWFVGWVESDRRWIFALNIDMRTADLAPLRQSLAIQSLRRLGYL